MCFQPTTYVFASLKKNGSHASGMHSIDNIMKTLYMKRAINDILNRHSGIIAGQTSIDLKGADI